MAAFIWFTQQNSVYKSILITVVASIQHWLKEHSICKWWCNYWNHLCWFGSIKQDYHKVASSNMTLQNWITMGAFLIGISWWDYSKILLKYIRYSHLQIQLCQIWEVGKEDSSAEGEVPGLLATLSFITGTVSSHVHITLFEVAVLNTLRVGLHMQLCYLICLHLVTVNQSLSMGHMTPWVAPTHLKVATDWKLGEGVLCLLFMFLLYPCLIWGDTWNLRKAPKRPKLGRKEEHNFCKWLFGAECVNYIF